MLYYIVPYHIVLLGGLHARGPLGGQDLALRAALLVARLAQLPLLHDAGVQAGHDHGVLQRVLLDRELLRGLQLGAEHRLDLIAVDDAGDVGVLHRGARQLVASSKSISCFRCFILCISFKTYRLSFFLFVFFLCFLVASSKNTGCSRAM